MKTKHTLMVLVGVLCLQVKYAHSQDGYISTDSSLSLGVKLVRNTPQFNSQYIILRGKSGETKYTPDQINEYGFKDGTVYESKKIILDNEEKIVFLERLIKGKITLYRYADSSHKTYYIKKDSLDIEELKNDLETMKALSQDCEFMTDAIRLTTYTKGSLRKLVSRYNQCVKRPFPYKKIGVMAGWTSMRLTQPTKASNAALAGLSIHSSSPVIGVFGDLPIEMSDFSLHPELFYTWNHIAANTRTAQSDVDVLIDLKTLHMPILVRYTVPTSNWRLFVDVGPNLVYNLENSSDIYHAKTLGNVISIERPLQEKLLSDFMFGYVAGVGLQRQLNHRKTLSAEFRFTRAIGGDGATFIQKGIDLAIGFTF